MKKLKSNFRKRGKFSDLKPFRWGKGTERVSEEVDNILYDESSK